MIIGLILVGSGIGAVSALMTLILGHSVWMALLVYSALGVLSTLAGATMLARRAEDDCPGPARPYAPPRPQRG